MRNFSKTIFQNVLLLFATGILSLNVSAQKFQVDTILYNGDPDKFINIVYMDDGYQNNELSNFINNTKSASSYFFSVSPFSEYKNYFNVFAIRVPSNQSGADHPHTAPDCPSESSQPTLYVDTYFNSVFDYFSIHRLLIPTNYTAINNVIVNNFPLFDQKIFLVNTPYYGGSGGSVATASVHASSNEIVIHEIGHSFAGLADEYWAGDTYASEKANMTKETNPALVKWKNWIGVENVGIYPYGTTGNQTVWYRPHNNCKMRFLGPDFCPVCKEAIARQVILRFGNPIKTYTPNQQVVTSCMNPITFKISLVKPNPNTLSVKWKLNGLDLAMNMDSVKILPVNLNSGGNTLSVQVLDTTALIRSEMHPASNTYTTSWTINNSVSEAAGTISGLTSVCKGQNSFTYAVPSIANATSYLWSLPDGATGTSTTNNITVNYGASAVSGNITVKGTSTCGDGAASTLAISVNPLPENAGLISGLTYVLKGQNNVIYSIPVVANATSYIWTLPEGTTGTSSTNSIAVNYGTSAVSGDIMVKGINTCGEGAVSTLSITVNSAYAQEIVLKKGWNIISTNLNLTNPDAKAVFQSLINDEALVKVQDENGNSLEDWGVFGGWINNIGEIRITEGYKVKVSKDCILGLIGISATIPCKIYLKSGWNIAGYPLALEFDGKAVVQQLIDHGTLIKVQDETGNSIENWGVFGGWQNNINNFRPGEGYKIKVSAADTLTIFESYPKTGSVLPQQIDKTTQFRPVSQGNGVDHMNINLVNIPSGMFQPGDEIGVYDENICVGAIKIRNFTLSEVEGRNLSITASGDDGTGEPGFAEGNKILLKIWKAALGKEYYLEPEIIKGSSTFLKHESSFVRLAKYTTTGLEKSNSSAEPDLKIFPNPTDGKVYVHYSGSSLTGMHISVINVLGQEILNQVVSKNPVIIDLSGKVSGVYYIYIMGDTWSKTEKVVLR